MTELLKIDADSPQAYKVKKAAGLLKQGKIIAIPTETVYGLAVNALNKEAIESLYAAKKRSEHKPFTIQIADFSQLDDYVDNIPENLQLILREFWPGPLTVIINGKKGKVGLRMPDNKVALSILKESDIPLAVTSANISGERSISSAKEVFDIFSGVIDMVVDDGRPAEGIESTVLDCTELPFKMLRKGSISDDLERLLRLYG